MNEELSLRKNPVCIFQESDLLHSALGACIWPNPLQCAYQQVLEALVKNVMLLYMLMIPMLIQVQRILTQFRKSLTEISQ